MAQRAARLVLDPVFRPVRVRHAQSGHPQPDSGLIKRRNRRQLLRRRSALQRLELDRVNGFMHGPGILHPAHQVLSLPRRFVEGFLHGREEIFEHCAGTEVDFSGELHAR